MALTLKIGTHQSILDGKVEVDFLPGGAADLPTNEPAVALRLQDRQLLMALREWQAIAKNVEEKVKEKTSEQ